MGFLLSLMVLVERHTFTYCSHKPKKISALLKSTNLACNKEKIAFKIRSAKQLNNNVRFALRQYRAFLIEH